MVIDSFAWVPAAETLYIAPGMVVAFSGRFSLVVNGTLIADGVGDDSIRVQRLPYHDPVGHLGIRFLETTTISRLNKVKFEDGFANAGSIERYGGALELYAAAVEIDSCLFQGNRARIDGGAIYCREAAMLTVRDCEFEGDSTRFGGGGAILARTSGTLRLIRCSFINNSSATSGGGVTTESGVTAELTDCYFAQNRAATRGGGLHLHSSPPATVVRGCTFEECTADEGGGIYTDNCRGSIEDCTIRFCFARVGGGFGARRGNNLTTISRTKIEANAAAEDGGGLYLTETSRCTLLNSLVINNIATRGGGVFSVAGTAPTIRFTIFAGNTAAGGSALDIYGGGVLKNSIVTGETGDALINFGVSAVITVSNNNIFSNTVPELSGFEPSWLLVNSRLNVALVECDSLRNLSLDPQFVDASNGDYRLSDASPCLFGADTSNSSGVDFSGNVRTAPLGSWPDMGAFESAAPLPYFQNCGPKRGVWHPGEYIVGCTLRVEPQDTLILMGGTRLLFGPEAGLYCEGTLLAMGTERDSVFFDRYFSLTGATWGGITLEASSTDSRLNFCSIKNVAGTSALTTGEPQTKIDHCRFSSNKNSAGYGGAVRVTGNATPVFTSCKFVENSARSGGAVYAHSQRTSFESCVFEHNTARNADIQESAGGGALYCNDGILQNCIFTDNRAYIGGAVYQENSGSFIECEFDSCEATLGGAVAIEGGIPVFTNLQFRNNHGKDYGGAVMLLNAELADDGSVYSKNRSLNGGALAAQAGYYLVIGSNFADNFAANQGGVAWLPANFGATFQNCTLYRNFAGTGGILWGENAGVDFSECLLDSNYATEACGGIFLLNGGVSFSRSTVVNHRSPTVGSVLHNRGTAALFSNSTLFAHNGENPLFEREGADNLVSFSMSDVPLRAGNEWIGLPDTTNFNVDSCDANLNLIAAPEFIDYAHRDYRLSGTSKAVHAADSLLPLDDDGTRADIGLFPGARPYLLPQPFNLSYPERDSHFHPGDTITFRWNPSFDGDPGDEIEYEFHLTSESLDTTIVAGAILSHSLILFNGQYTWWVVAKSLRPEAQLESYERRTFVVADPTLDIAEGLIPQEFSVTLDGPNPFNNSTRLKIALPRSTQITLTLFDVLGRVAQEIPVQNYFAGRHTLTIDGTALGSGVYWIQAKTNLGTKTLKLLLVK